jgi:predicted transcriptional regulator
MPVGAFSTVRAEPPCGMSKVDGPIGIRDSAAMFSHPDRFLAQSLSMGHGYVEYEFPREFPAGVRVVEVSFTAEVSSEASLPVGINECPSDLTLWVNAVKIGTWTCPGFFTGTRGRHTPSWVSIQANQFGLLKTWRINRDGAKLDGLNLSSVKPEDLRLFQRRVITVRLGIEDDATYRGGLHLFGARFGNYALDLVLEVRYKVEPVADVRAGSRDKG